MAGEMIPITIHEEHEMDFIFYPPYSAGNTNWDDAMTEYLEEATWDPLTGWVGQQFTDTMWMISTAGYSLLPQSVWHPSNKTPVVSKSQKFFAGTSTPPSHMTDNYTGACVQVNRQLFSIERADPVAIISPVYPSSLCARGVSVPVQ